MAVVTTWKKLNFTGKYKQVLLKMTYGNGDTTVTVATGLNKIISHSESATSVAGKTVTRAVVSGGTITLTVTDPLAACYLFVTALGW